MKRAGFLGALFSARPGVAHGIVLVSLLGAIAGYLGTLSSQRAADEGWRAIADLTVRQQVDAASYSHASSDLRTLLEFESASRAYEELQRQARATKDPKLAAALRSEADDASHLVTGEFWLHRGVLDPREAVTLDASIFRTTANQDLKDIHGAFDPDAHEVSAAKAGKTSGRYRRITVAFAVAFFFLSLAELTRRRRIRNVFAFVGLATALTGLVVWIAG